MSDPPQPLLTAEPTAILACQADTSAMRQPDQPHEPGEGLAGIALGGPSLSLLAIAPPAPAGEVTVAESVG